MALKTTDNCHLAAKTVQHCHADYKGYCLKAGISLFFFCGRQKFNKCGRFVHTRARGWELGEFNMYKSGGWRNVFYKRVLQEAISHPSSAEGKLLKRFWEPFKKEKMEFHFG